MPKSAQLSDCHPPHPTPPLPTTTTFEKKNIQKNDIVLPRVVTTTCRRSTNYQSKNHMEAALSVWVESIEIQSEASRSGRSSSSHFVLSSLLLLLRHVSSLPLSNPLSAQGSVTAAICATHAPSLLPHCSLTARLLARLPAR